jgi:hypothetical protein
MPDGTLEGIEEGDDESTSDGFELGFWLTVGSSDAVNDGAPLGLVEGDDVVGAADGLILGTRFCRCRIWR